MDAAKRGGLNARQPVPRSGLLVPHGRPPGGDRTSTTREGQQTGQARTDKQRDQAARRRTLVSGPGPTDSRADVWARSGKAEIRQGSSYARRHRPYPPDAVDAGQHRARREIPDGETVKTKRRKV